MKQKLFRIIAFALAFGLLIASTLVVNAEETSVSEARRERETDSSYVDKPIDPLPKEAEVFNMTEEMRIAATESVTGVKHGTSLVDPRSIPWKVRGRTVAEKVTITKETAQKMIEVLQEGNVTVGTVSEKENRIISVDSNGVILSSSTLALNEATIEKLAFIYLEQLIADNDGRWSEYDEILNKEYIEEDGVWVFYFFPFNRQELEGMIYGGASVTIAISDDGTLQRCYLC